MQPDIVCMQETKLPDDGFPALAFEALGYTTAHHGQGQWNGVAILSRIGITDVVAGFADGEPPDPEARLISATCGGIRVSSVYVPNGRGLDQDHYQYKLQWLARLRRHVQETTTPSQPVVVAGDFNIAPTDIDVYDPTKFLDTTHTSPPEREALAALEGWGLEDVFRRHYDAGSCFSWWDYRAGDFHEGRGMRIDLVLATAPVAAASRWCVIDRNARKGKQPSDHAPVVVDLDWPPPTAEHATACWTRTGAGPRRPTRQRRDGRAGSGPRRAGAIAASRRVPWRRAMSGPNPGTAPSASTVEGARRRSRRACGRRPRPARRCGRRGPRRAATPVARRAADRRADGSAPAAGRRAARPAVPPACSARSSTSRYGLRSGPYQVRTSLALGPGDGDVEQAALLVAGGRRAGAGVRDEPGHEPDDHDRRPLQALGGVEGRQRDGVVVDGETVAAAGDEPGPQRGPVGRGLLCQEVLGRPDERRRERRARPPRRRRSRRRCPRPGPRRRGSSRRACPPATPGASRARVTERSSTRAAAVAGSSTGPARRRCGMPARASAAATGCSWALVRASTAMARQRPPGGRTSLTMAATPAASASASAKATARGGAPSGRLATGPPSPLPVSTAWPRPTIWGVERWLRRRCTTVAPGWCAAKSSSHRPSAPFHP